MREQSRIYAPALPVYRIPNLEINPTQFVDRALSRFHDFELDRKEWLERREMYYLGWDDYFSPSRKGPWDGSSNVHLPMTEIQCNALHARLMQAFFGLENWFYVDPQEEVDVERIQKIELMMKYVLMRYANHNKGIYSAIDDWCWDLVTDGVGILSRDWRILQRRHIRVVENEEFKKQKLELEALLQDDVTVEDFDDNVKKLMQYPYKEEAVIRTLFNGPIIVAEDPHYVLFKGDVVDCTDLDRQETVMQVCYFTPDELLAFSQSEQWDEEVVDSILATPPDRRGNTTGTMYNSRVEQTKDAITGTRTMNSVARRDEYEFIKVWDRFSLETNGSKKSKITDELVYYVHTTSRQLSYWTFLDRLSSNGKRNLHMAHLYRRPRRSTGRGMVETQFPLNETMDLLINQSIDAGMLANQPMFGFRGNSTFDPQEVRIEPGLGLRMDDPNNDIRFFDWKVNPTWSSGIMSVLQQFAYQLTSLGPNSMGQVGDNVGPLRSASGVRELLGETSTNLDVIIKRAKMPYSEMMEGLYMDCMDRMPDRLWVTVTGPEGEPELSEDGLPRRIQMTKEELRARVHFGLYANSQNLNKPAQEAAAMKIAQFLLQRVGLETGIVKPENVYEIYMNVIRTMGVQRAYRFLSKPQNRISIPLQAELLMIMQGLKPPIVISDPEHERKVEVMTELLNSDQAALEIKYGIVNKDAMSLLKDAIEQHTKFLELLQQPTNLQNPTGMQSSPALGGTQGQAQQQPPQPPEPQGQAGQSPGPQG